MRQLSINLTTYIAFYGLLIPCGIFTDYLISNAKASEPISQSASKSNELFQPTVVPEGEYIIATVEGVGDTRASAMDQAWLEALRLAVGMMIEARTEINQDKIAENIISHSRGVVEGYEILAAETSGGVYRLRMKAKVRKDILRDGLQYVASKGQVISFSLDDLKQQKDLSLAQLETQDSEAKSEEKMAQEAANLLTNIINKYNTADFLMLQAKGTLKPVDGKPDTFELDFDVSFNEEKYYNEYIPDLTRVLGQVSQNKQKKYLTSSEDIEKIRALRKAGVESSDGRSLFLKISPSKSALILDKSNEFAYYLYEVPSHILNKLIHNKQNRMKENLSISIKFNDEDGNEIWDITNKINAIVSTSLIGSSSTRKAVVLSVTSVPRHISDTGDSISSYTSLYAGEEVFFTGISTLARNEIYHKIQKQNTNEGDYWLKEDLFKNLSNGKEILNGLNTTGLMVIYPSILTENAEKKTIESLKHSFTAPLNIPTELLKNIKTIKIDLIPQ